MTAIIISGSSKAKTQMYATQLSNYKTAPKNISILGPVEAPIFLLRGKYRYRLLMKGNSRK